MIDLRQPVPSLHVVDDYGINWYDNISFVSISLNKGKVLALFELSSASCSGESFVKTTYFLIQD